MTVKNNSNQTSFAISYPVSEKEPDNMLHDIDPIDSGNLNGYAKEKYHTRKLSMNDLQA